MNKRTSSNCLELTSEQYDYFREELNRRVTPHEKQSRFPFYDEIVVQDLGSSLRFRMMNLQRYYPIWDVHVVDAGALKRIEWSAPKMAALVRMQWMLAAVWTCYMAFHRMAISYEVVFVLIAYGLFALGFYHHARKDAQATLNGILNEAANAARVRSVTQKSAAKL